MESCAWKGLNLNIKRGGEVDTTHKERRRSARGVCGVLIPTSHIFLDPLADYSSFRGLGHESGFNLCVVLNYILSSVCKCNITWKTGFSGG